MTARRAPHDGARATRRPIHGVLVAGCVAVVAWGALAFGSVYPWAYTPLAATCAAIGGAALFIERRGRPPVRGLAIGFAAILMAIGIQLVPLPLPLLARISPGADAFLSQYDFSYQIARSGNAPEGTAGSVPHPTHPISIAPEKTVVGAALFAALALFLLGVSRLLSVVGAQALARWVIAFGAVLALVGIAQRGLTAGEQHPLIYGFWHPQFEAMPFGPYVNPNHFAGWMLMALPLGLAAFFDVLVGAIEAGAAAKGNRAAMIASSSFATLLTLGVASVVMGLSLLMTRSRSALAAFAFGSMIVAWIAFRRQATRGGRVAVLGSVALLLVVTAGWAGIDTMVSKFTEAQGPKSLSTRLAAWRDTRAIIRDFPVTGSGFNTYGRAMMVYQTAARELHFQEAHNDYLQLAAEGGVLVGLPVLATIAIFARDIRRRFREAPKLGTTYYLRVGAAVGLLSIALQSVAEFSLQMPGNAVLFAVLAAIAVHQSPRLRP